MTTYGKATSYPDTMGDEVITYGKAFMLHRADHEEFASNWMHIVRDLVLEANFSNLIDQVPLDKIK